MKVLTQKCVTILRHLSSPDCGLRKIYSQQDLSDITTAYQETVMKVKLGLTGVYISFLFLIMGTYEKRLIKVVLMSTHNLHFEEK